MAGACVDSRSEKERAGEAKSNTSSRGDGLGRNTCVIKLSKLSNCCHTGTEGEEPNPFFPFLGLSQAPSSCAARRDGAHLVRFQRSKTCQASHSASMVAVAGHKEGYLLVERGCGGSLQCFDDPCWVGAVTQPRAGHSSSSRCDPCGPARARLLERCRSRCYLWCQCQDLASCNTKTWAAAEFDQAGFCRNHDAKCMCMCRQKSRSIFSVMVHWPLVI
jgi:hypothetical protein